MATFHRTLEIPNAYLAPKGVSADGKWAELRFWMPSLTPLSADKSQDRLFDEENEQATLSNAYIVEISVCPIADEGIDGCPQSPKQVIELNSERTHTTRIGERLLSEDIDRVEAADRIFDPVKGQFFGESHQDQHAVSFISSCDDPADERPPDRVSLCKIEAEFPESELAGQLILHRPIDKRMLEAAKAVAAQLNHWEHPAP